jgi:hypothetical protein
MVDFRRIKPKRTSNHLWKNGWICLGGYVSPCVYSNLIEKIYQVNDKTIEKTEVYAWTVYQESMMHYHKDNQYADAKSSEEYANSITDQNIFVANESVKSIRYFKKTSNH